MDIAFEFFEIRELLLWLYVTLTGNEPSEQIIKIFAIFIIISLLIFIIYIIFILFLKIKMEIIKHRKETAYDDKKRRKIWNQRFAKHISLEINRINTYEDWYDYNFTNLDAEIEVSNEPINFLFLKIPQFNTNKKKRKSLIKAIEKNSSRLILLEGEPGSGKSVALRHTVLKISEKVSKRKKISPIPLYINLKGLKNRKNEEVNSLFIRNFILQELNRVGHRDIEEFLDDYFDIGLQNGEWIFFFDSFDEIPKVLSSKDYDKTVSQYANAIWDFMNGSNDCRAILASREYKGPKQALNWTKFKILDLSDKQRKKLIKKYELPKLKEKELINILISNFHPLSELSTNPMFLAIICSYFKGNDNNQLPQNSYSILSNYFESRFSRDKERILKKFNISINELKYATECIAFTINNSDFLGLEPAKEEIIKEFNTYEFAQTLKDPNIYLEALNYIKIIKTNINLYEMKSENISFFHRRFQEYFSTEFVIKNNDYLDVNKLISEANWRDTLVILLQSQPIEKITSILSLIEFNLDQLTKDWKIINLKSEEIKKDIPKNENKLPLFQRLFQENKNPNQIQNIINLIFESDEPLPKKNISTTKRSNIIISNKIFHILGILNSGFSFRKDLFSQKSIEKKVANIIFYITNYGTLQEKKWALENISWLSEKIQTNLIKKINKNEKVILQELLFKIVCKINNSSIDIKKIIINKLFIDYKNGDAIKNFSKNKFMISFSKNVKTYNRYIYMLSFFYILIKFLIQFFPIIIFLFTKNYFFLLLPIVDIFMNTINIEENQNKYFPILIIQKSILSAGLSFLIVFLISLQYNPYELIENITKFSLYYAIIFLLSSVAFLNYETIIELKETFLETVNFLFLMPIKIYYIIINFPLIVITIIDNFMKKNKVNKRTISIIKSLLLIITLFILIIYIIYIIFNNSIIASKMEIILVIILKKILLLMISLFFLLSLIDFLIDKQMIKIILRKNFSNNKKIKINDLLILYFTTIKNHRNQIINYAINNKLLIIDQMYLNMINEIFILVEEKITNKESVKIDSLCLILKISDIPNEFDDEININSYDLENLLKLSDFVRTQLML